MMIEVTWLFNGGWGLGLGFWELCFKFSNRNDIAQVEIVVIVVVAMSSFFASNNVCDGTLFLLIVSQYFLIRGLTPTKFHIL